MYSLRAERTAIMAELQNEMGSVEGGREFAQQRQQHAEDVQAIGARLRSLQSYVETAEAELSQHEENSTKARAVLPGAARELATLALTFSEDGQQGEAAAHLQERTRAPSRRLPPGLPPGCLDPPAPSWPGAKRALAPSKPFTFTLWS